MHNQTVEIQNFIGFNRYADVLKDLATIKRQLTRPVTPIQQYAKTKHAAAYLDVDPSFLDKKRKSGAFQSGLHYFKPPNSKLILWDLKALDQWVRNMEDQDEYDNLVNKMFA